MWKPFYQRRARAFVRRARATRPVELISAEETDLNGLQDWLATAPSLFVYFGHGHSKGWTGFRGVRTHHFPAPAAADPVGCILSFSCAALETPPDGGLSFGEQLLRESRVRCFVGTVEALDIASLARLANLFARALTDQKVTSPESLMAEVAAMVDGQRGSGVKSAWRGIRCIGDARIGLNVKTLNASALPLPR